MILDRHYIQDHSHKLLNVYPSMCLHTLPKLPLLPQFRILFFSKSEMAHIEPLLQGRVIKEFIELNDKLSGTSRVYKVIQVLEPVLEGPSATTWELWPLAPLSSPLFG